MNTHIADIEINGFSARVIETANDAFEAGEKPFLRAARRALGSAVAQVTVNLELAAGFDVQEDGTKRRSARKITAISKSGSVIGTGWAYFQ
jgi:hypothetical protein